MGKNKEDRIWMVRFWAEYVRTHKDWYKQHNEFINSFFKKFK